MTQMLRAYIYARVSNDDEDGNNASAAAQCAACRAWCAKNGVEVIEEFEELNVSGRKLKRRQFDRMIAQATASERPVHMIVVYALSRFARRLLTQVTAEHRLAEAGVRLVSLIEELGDDPNGKMMRWMIAVMNEKYANDASIFTARDRRGNAAAGYWNGGPIPYGYDSRVVVTEGRKGRKKLIYSRGRGGSCPADLPARGCGYRRPADGNARDRDVSERQRLHATRSALLP